MALLLIARKWCKFQTEARQAVAFKDAERGRERDIEMGGDLGVEGRRLSSRKRRQEKWQGK